MTNSTVGLKTKITVGGQELQIMIQFRYVGAIISEEGSKPEVLARANQQWQNLSLCRFLILL